MKLSDCPIRTALDVIAGKWKPVILYHLMSGKKRHSELRKLLADASQKMLTQQLRELERDGIVQRDVLPIKPQRVEYRLTPYGQTLRSVMRELCLWGETRTKLN
jgi:DNA-binding HxlR family transcriptional regulator